MENSFCQGNNAPCSKYPNVRLFAGFPLWAFVVTLGSQSFIAKKGRVALELALPFLLSISNMFGKRIVIIIQHHIKQRVDFVIMGIESYF